LAITSLISASFFCGVQSNTSSLISYCPLFEAAVKKNFFGKKHTLVSLHASLFTVSLTFTASRLHFTTYTPTSQFLFTTSQLLLFHNSTALYSRLITLGSIISQPAFTVTSVFKGTFWGILLVYVIRRLSDHGSIGILQTNL